MSRSPAFTERHARRAARDAGLIAQKLRPWAGFILIQPENNAMVSRELTAEEVVTYCGILSAIDSWEVRSHQAGHRSDPSKIGGATCQRCVRGGRVQPPHPCSANRPRIAE